MTAKPIDFDLTDFPGCSVQSFTLRELSGSDSLAAASRSINPQGPNPIFGFQHRNQCVADAIVAVDGKPVTTPYVAWETWNLRTQEFVTKAYDEMNGVSKEEMERFLAKAGLKPAVTPGATGPRT